MSKELYQEWRDAKGADTLAALWRAGNALESALSAAEQRAVVLQAELDAARAVAVVCPACEGKKRVPAFPINGGAGYLPCPTCHGTSRTTAGDVVERWRKLEAAIVEYDTAWRAFLRMTTTDCDGFPAHLRDILEAKMRLENARAALGRIASEIASLANEPTQAKETDDEG